MIDSTRRALVQALLVDVLLTPEQRRQRHEAQWDAAARAKLKVSQRAADEFRPRREPLNADELAALRERIAGNEVTN